MSDPASYSENKLLQRLAEGDDLAFNILYRRYYSVIFNAAMLYVKDAESAAEIVQQVFVNIWVKRAMMVNVENFQHYVVVSSRNLIYDQFRKKTNEARHIARLADSRQGKEEDSYGNIDNKEYLTILRAAIDQLPPQQKKVYLLVNEEGMSYDEAAKTLGLSKFTVKKHLELARGFVREYVARYITVICFLFYLISNLI